jgi:hypothetical protein
VACAQWTSKHEGGRCVIGYPVQRANITRPLYFLLVEASDHITGATGRSPSVTILKNSGDYAAPAGSIVEDGNGLYHVSAHPSDADTLGPLFLHATASGCDPRDDEFEVLPDLAASAIALASSSATTNAVTGRTIVTGALKLLAVVGAGETPSSEDINDGLVRLNEMIDSWGTERLLVPSLTRNVYSLNTASSYTIGAGGDFNQAWPHHLDHVGVIVNTSGFDMEFPLSALTDAQYARLPWKAQTNAWPTSFYYDHAYGSGLGTITLWPVPDGTQTVSLVIYSQAVLSQYPSIATAYAYPAGYAKALRYNLALELAPEYERQPSPLVMREAAMSKALIKRANVRITDLSLGLAFGATRSPYNIFTDS